MFPEVLLFEFTQGIGIVGAHAFSVDAVHWTWSRVAPYSTNITFEGGNVRTMKRRERPQLTLDGQGRPLYFTSGVEDEHDHSYTLTVEVAHDA